MMNYFKGLLNFEKLYGADLLKIIYYIGLVGIGIGFLFGLVGAFASFGQGFFAGLLSLILLPIFTLLGLLFWRFINEIYLLLFRFSDDLRDIKNHQLGLTPNTKDIDSEFS